MVRLTNDNFQDTLEDKVSRNSEDNPDTII